MDWLFVDAVVVGLVVCWLVVIDICCAFGWQVFVVVMVVVVVVVSDKSC